MAEEGGVFANGRRIIFKDSKAKLLTEDPCYLQSGSIQIFPNIATAKDAVNTATSVFIEGKPVLTQDSQLSTTRGSEGAVCGISSGTLFEACDFLTSSTDVLVAGVGVLRDQDLGVANAKNTAPKPILFPHGSRVEKKSATVIYHNISEQEHDKLNIKLWDVARFNNESVDVLLEHDLIQRTCISLSINKRIEDNLNIADLAWDNLAKNQSYNICLTVQALNAGYINDQKQVWANCYPIPMFKAMQSSEEFKADPAYILAPFYPVRLNAENKPEVLRAGYIYIFRDNKLWREIKVTLKDGVAALQDVNWYLEYGKDDRSILSQAYNYIILPVIDNNNPVKLEFAFSEIQWSFAYIQKQGGVCDVIREIAKTLVGNVETKDEQDSNTVTANWLRETRCKQNRLHEYKPGSIADLQTQNNIELNINFLKSNLKDNTPLLIILDPIGIAREMAQAIRQLVYDYVILDAMVQGNYKVTQEEAWKIDEWQARYACADLLFKLQNDAALSPILGIELKAELKQEIITQKQRLVEYLSKQEMYDFNIAMLDYIAKQDIIGAYKVILALIDYNALHDDIKNDEWDPILQFMHYFTNALQDIQHPLSALLLPAASFNAEYLEDLLFVKADALLYLDLDKLFQLSIWHKNELIDIISKILACLNFNADIKTSGFGIKNISQYPNELKNIFNYKIGKVTKPYHAFLRILMLLKYPIIYARLPVFLVLHGIDLYEIEMLNKDKIIALMNNFLQVRNKDLLLQLDYKWAGDIAKALIPRSWFVVKLNINLSATTLVEFLTQRKALAQQLSSTNILNYEAHNIEQKRAVANALNLATLWHTVLVENDMFMANYQMLQQAVNVNALYKQKKVLWLDNLLESYNIKNYLSFIDANAFLYSQLIALLEVNSNRVAEYDAKCDLTLLRYNYAAKFFASLNQDEKKLLYGKEIILNAKPAVCINHERLLKLRKCTIPVNSGLILHKFNNITHNTFWRRLYRKFLSDFSKPIITITSSNQNTRELEVIMPYLDRETIIDMAISVFNQTFSVPIIKLDFMSGLIVHENNLNIKLNIKTNAFNAGCKLWIQVQLSNISSKEISLQVKYQVKPFGNATLGTAILVPLSVPEPKYDNNSLAELLEECEECWSG